MDSSVESWIDLCAKQLAVRLLDLSQAQCAAFAKNLHTGDSETNPIEAANVYSQLYRDLQGPERRYARSPPEPSRDVFSVCQSP